MKQKSNKTLIKIFKKYQIDIKIVQYEGVIRGSYQGFNNIYSDYIDLEFIIYPNVFTLTLKPRVTLKFVKEFDELEGIKVIKNKDDTVAFYIEKDDFENLNKDVDKCLKKLFDPYMGKYLYYLMFANTVNSDPKKEE